MEEMTQDSAITQQMRDAIGVESEAAVHDVEKGAIVKFARAIGDPNPAFNDDSTPRGMVAPPTFLRSMLPGPLTVEADSPYKANLDGGSEWEYFGPVRSGDRISVTTKVLDIYERVGRLGNMLFIIRETRYVNRMDALVAVQRTTDISYDPLGG